MKTFPLPVIHDAYAKFDERVAQSLALACTVHGTTSPCKRGCSACCSEPLLVTQYCMPPIIEAIRAMPAEQQEAIKLRFIAWKRVVYQKGIHPDTSDEGLDFDLWHQQPKPVCPLLDVATGDCMVYEARPLGCRGHVSVEKDASPCNRTKPGKGIAVLLFTDEIARVIGYVLGQTVRGPNRDVPLLMLLLPSMLRRAWVLVERPKLTYFEWFDELERRANAGEQI